MIFGYLILLTSLTLSGVAAYYSVTGLVAIFSALPIPIIIMGATLEAGKIVSTVWLHNNWKRASVAFKLYLIPAIVVLMFLTSVGIFGLLSKAHGDQSLVSGDAMARVAIYDEKIKISKDNIDANRRALKQMDEAVDQVMGRSSDEKGADKAVQIRRSQQKERARLQSEIQAEQKTITALGQEAAPLRAEFRKVEAEVGPIKYIAALIYGDNPDQNLLEAAVRWVIILIVVVFDPLALCLILAANKQLEWARQGRGGWVHDEEEKPVPVATATEEPPIESPPHDEPYPELTEEQLEQIRAIAANAAVDKLEKPDPVVEVIEPEVEQFFANAQATSQAIDGGTYQESELDIPVLENEEMWAQRVIDEHKEEDDPPLEEPKPVDEFNTPIRRGADYAVRYKGKVYNLDAFNKLYPSMAIQADNDKLEAASQCGFGERFPETPMKGDMFIRTDYLPDRLFKWNGQKWIEVDKNTTDSYTYNQAYIQHLISKLEAGEYEIEDLSDAEQAQVEQQIEEIIKSKNG